MVAARLPTPLPKAPLSCSTHLSNDVNERLRQAKLSSRAFEFCLFLHRQTFGNAGWHRKQGRAEWHCRFELATWARALACDKSNLRRLRLGLEAAHIIHFEPDEDDSGQGWVSWNLRFEQWQPYDGRRTRNPGQTKPRQQAHVVISREQVRQEAGYQQENVVILPAQTPPIHQAGMVRWPHPEGAKQPRPLDQNALQLTTPASSQVSPEAASSAPLIKGLRKKATKTPNVVFEAQSASPEASGVFDVQETGAEGPTLLPPDFYTQEAPTTSETPKIKTTTPAFSWPAREAWERTDLDFYQRVLRDRDSQRVALLTHLAHERIGVRLASPSYARIGALAKQCGAALLVKHILLAAAQHIDGDSLDYLTKLVTNTHRKETHHDERPTTPRPADHASSSRPYSREEAKQLVWNT
jgi:hypothetical protein